MSPSLADMIRAVERAARGHPSSDIRGQTAALYAAALRSREQRERRKAETPPDVRAMIERGKRERAELERQARDAAEVGRLLAQIDARWARIKRAANVASRARMRLAALRAHARTKLGCDRLSHEPVLARNAASSALPIVPKRSIAASSMCGMG